jgi:hypothetical protein
MEKTELVAKPLKLPSDYKRVKFASVILGSRFFHNGVIYQKVNDFKDGKPMYSGAMATGGNIGSQKSIPDCDPDLMVWAHGDSIKKGGS